MSDKQINVADEFLAIRDRYKKESERRGFNALIYGDFGTGKTYLLHTAPKPVLVHSFDPGGGVTLRKWVKSGEVLVDSRFERDEGEQGDPEAYILWEKEFARLREVGFFDHIGTYVIDSLTSMSESLMNAIMARGFSKKEGPRQPYHREIQTYIPQQQDYLVQQYTMRDFLNICCGLPCNFICTSHIDRKKDEVTGSIIATPMITGKFAQKIPMLFDEVYIADVKRSQRGAQYHLKTESSGIYRSRSRLAASISLDPEEKPDIRHIMRKCDFNYDDKPLFMPPKDESS